MNTSPSSAPTPCDFCMRLDPSFQADHWADFKVIERTDHFRVVIALGALTPGHVMVVSERHYASMASMPYPQIEELVSLSHTWMQRVRERFGSTAICFEHGGGPCPAATSGPCVHHAHLQILPSPAGFSPPTSFHPLKGSIAELASHEYLYLRIAGRELVCVEQHPGKYFRRLLSPYFGAPDQWDYLAHPNYQNMAQTLDELDQGLGPA